MPIYRYVCAKKERCKLSDLPEDFFEGEGELEYRIDFDERLTKWNEDGLIVPEESTIVQLAHHSMDATPEIKCPGCNGETSRIIGKTQFYFPGNCFLNKEDCRKQMMLHKLKNDDPYGHMRPEGDKEELIKKIKRGSKDPSKNFYPGGSGGLKAPFPHRPGT